MRSIVFFSALLVSAAAVAQESDDKESSTEIDAGLLSGVGFRSIGPALMSGRISDLAVDPTRPNTWYVCVGSGGIFKTENAGTTFTPIFDNYASYSIGCIALDPSVPDTVWVGTGEAVGGRHVGFGDGVYRSRDGGRSFQNVGLKESEHIGKILVDPRNSDVVYVASQGPLWSPGGERGLYKTTDGGQSWELLLSDGPYTGVTDVVFDPRDPDVLYAATHQRHRTVAALMNGGPESGIHKSMDGGRTWRKLGNGLPGGDKGKISLAVSPQNPDVVYAAIELPQRKGGFWRSHNAGESWTKQSDVISGGTGPHYYQEIWADPHRENVLYFADVVLQRTEDGGKTWTRLRNRRKHVDNHAVAFHPHDPDFLLVGCDGGLYKSYDRGATYDFTENLPLTQFYKVDVDYDWPIYHVVGGTQDNNTQYGPTRTLDRQGIRNSDWKIVIGGDGHDCAIDPVDPNVIYCESQQGYLRRYDRTSGESIGIRPQPGKGEDYFRFNWDSPILISPHQHTRVYFGSKLLHKSEDRGDSWESISGDLSRGQNRLTMPIMGRTWSVDDTWDLYAMSQFGNITSISESPLVEGLIYVGTDDGLIHVTEDGGENWRRIDKIYGIPQFAFVNDIKADLHDADTAYAVLDNHKEGDFAPYVLKSTDRGRTWEPMVGDLPERHLTWRIIQDHEKPELLFLATEFGVFCTLDGGEEWMKLSGAPTIPFRDLEIQRRENDLVGATFGRGFYVLDDYSFLRSLDEETMKEQELTLFAVKTALLYEQTRAGGSQGDTFFVAENPPYGAVFTYHKRDSWKTQAAMRKKSEAKAKKSGGDTPFPGWEALKEEDREEAPQLLFEIRDADGNVVNRVSGTTSKGLHRVTWDLRYSPFTADFGAGPRVLPGAYTVQAIQRRNGETTPLGEPMSFDVQAIGESAVPRQDRGETLAFYLELGQMQRSVNAARETIDEALEEVRAMANVIRTAREMDLAAWQEARDLEIKLLDAQESLRGDSTSQNYGEVGAPSILSRLSNVLFAGFGNSYGPTLAHREQYQIAREEYEAVLGQIRQVVEQDLEALRSKLDEANAPWTSGRKIPAFGGAGAAGGGE